MMSFSKKLKLAFVVIFSAFLFFSIGFSELDNFLKTVLMLSVLVLSGMLIGRLTGMETYYGIIMLRGKAGLGFMEKLAKKHPDFFREVADFGLSMGFGLPYSFMLFYKKPRKFLLHAFFVVLFFLLLSFAYAGAPGSPSSVQTALFVLALGLLGGLAGLGFVLLAIQAMAILTVPNIPAGVMLVIPGLTVPLEWVVAILIAAAVHEIAHGVLSRVEKLNVTSSGGVLFGFLPIGAFVEPDEKKFKKIDTHKKRRILVAGTTANFFTALLFFLLTLLVLPAYPLFAGGLSIASVSNTSSALGVLFEGERVLSVNGQPVLLQADLARFSKGGFLSIETSQKTLNVSITEVVVDSVSVSTFAYACTGIAKFNPFDECFVGYSIACSAASVFCRPADYSVPAKGVLSKGELFLEAEGVVVRSSQDLASALSEKRAGDEVVFKTNRGVKKLVLDSNGKIGVHTKTRATVLFEEVPKQGMEFAYDLFKLFLSILSSTAYLNFALAVINLLPLFITDGSRLVYEELLLRFKEKYSDKNSLSAKITVFVGLATVAMLLINLIVPHIG
ncbi:MAG: site-2 protease family protein [Candidatus Micrarchaeia archaeon]